LRKLRTKSTLDQYSRKKSSLHSQTLRESEHQLPVLNTHSSVTIKPSDFSILKNLISASENPYQDQQNADNNRLRRNSSLSLMSRLKRGLLAKIEQEKNERLQWEEQKEYVKRKLLKIQKSCMEEAEDTGSKITKISRSLEREDTLRKSLEFTMSTLQEYDTVEPHGLDIIFEYKVNDETFQEVEAK